MKLSGRTLSQVLLSCGDVVTLRQILDNLLTDPATIEDFSLRVRKPPLEVRNSAGISALFPKVGGVVDINLVICTTYSWSANVPTHKTK